MKNHEEIQLLKCLNSICQVALTCKTEEEIGESFLNMALDITQSKCGLIGVINSNGRLDELAICVPDGGKCNTDKNTAHLKLHKNLKLQGLYGSVILNCKTLLTNHPCSHPNCIDIHEGHLQLQSFLGVPLMENKKAIGIVAVANRIGGYSEEDRETLEAISTTFAHVLKRWRAEELLRNSEEVFRNAINSSVEGFCRIDVLFDAQGNPVDYIFLEVNPAFLNITDLHNAVGKSMRSLAPDHEKYWFEIYGKVAVTGKPIRFEHEAKALHRWYDVYAFKAGRQDERIVALHFNDISKRKNAEEELRKSRLEQEKQSKFYETIIASASDCICVWNRDLKLVYGNNNFDKLFGFTRKEYIGKSILEVGYPPELYEQEYREINQVIKTKQPVKGEAPFFKNKNIHFNYILNPIISDDGTVEYIVSVSRDVTEHRLSEQALEIKKQQALALVRMLQKADEDKNKFLSTLSHELRNPLTAITAGITYLDMIHDEQKIKNVKEIIKRQAGQLCRLVDDLLDITRFTNKKFKLIKEHTNLNALVSKAVNDYQINFEEQERMLDTDITTTPIFLDVDPVRITQAIGNLLHNAKKFTEKDGKTLLTLIKDNNEAVIIVKDNGVGINPKKIDELFQPFVQVETTLDRRNSGLGLGLSIVKSITLLHGGRVSASSEGLGKGMQFEIRLPICQEAVGEKVMQKADSKVIRPLRILLVEDNLVFSEILCDIFKELGHEATAVHNGIDGVEKAKEYLPEIIFCDIGLPDLDGYEVARRIRKEDTLKKMIMIALSGYAGTDDIKRAMEAGFDQHIAKPVEIEALNKILAKVSLAT